MEVGPFYVMLATISRFLTDGVTGKSYGLFTQLELSVNRLSFALIQCIKTSNETCSHLLSRMSLGPRLPLFSSLTLTTNKQTRNFSCGKKITINFYVSVFSLALVSIEKIYQTLKFTDQNYSATRCIFNSLLDVWNVVKHSLLCLTYYIFFDYGGGIHLESVRFLSETCCFVSLIPSPPLGSFLLGDPSNRTNSESF